MTGFPRSPLVQKGALIGLDPFNPLASIIIFQYNPETLTRTVTAQTSGQDGNPNEALRFKGPAKENIRADIEIDATDQLETGDPLAGELGIHPTLASLEMLLYPKTAIVIANEVLKAAGVIEVIPPEAPLTLFIWGIKRVLPVRVTSFTITEEAFDRNLNPIQAKVTLNMDVLTYQDLGLLSVGGALHMAHTVVKEVMATIGGVSNIAGSFSASVNVSIGG